MSSCPTEFSLGMTALQTSRAREKQHISIRFSSQLSFSSRGAYFHSGNDDFGSELRVGAHICRVLFASHSFFGVVSYEQTFNFPLRCEAGPTPIMFF
jgi:hypothetical protein